MIILYIAQGWAKNFLHNVHMHVFRSQGLEFYGFIVLHTFTFLTIIEHKIIFFVFFYFAMRLTWRVSQLIWDQICLLLTEHAPRLVPKRVASTYGRLKLFKISSLLKTFQQSHQWQTYYHKSIHFHLSYFTSQP